MATDTTDLQEQVKTNTNTLVRVEKHATGYLRLLMKFIN